MLVTDSFAPILWVELALNLILEIRYEFVADVVVTVRMILVVTFLEPTVPELVIVIEQCSCEKLVMERTLEVGTGLPAVE